MCSWIYSSFVKLSMNHWPFALAFNFLLVVFWKVNFIRSSSLAWSSSLRLRFTFQFVRMDGWKFPRNELFILNRINNRRKMIFMRQFYSFFMSETSKQIYSIVFFVFLGSCWFWEEIFRVLRICVMPLWVFKKLPSVSDCMNCKSSNMNSFFPH